MIQPRLVLELARKDLLLFLADRRGAALCFGVPILLASAFGAIFHRPDGGNDIRPSVLVVSASSSSFASSVVSGLCASDKVEARCVEEATARRRLADESVIVLMLPCDFGMGEGLAGKGPGLPAVRILYHPSLQWESRWVEGVFTEIVLRQAARSFLAPLGRLRREALTERPFQVEREAVPSGGALAAHAYSHSFCGMTLQYLLFWGMDSGLLLLRERRQGIWRRLRVAPLTRSTLLAGKALATALIALAQVALTFLFGALVFGVRIEGSVLGFGVVALALSILSASTGLLVAGLGGSEARARSVAILAILTLSLLGGLWLPSFLLPRWAQRLSLALPTTWAARGLEGVTWQGMDLAGALRCAGVVLGFSLVFLAVAWWGLLAADAPERADP
jgi:ABC-2 type transport system permease protein